ncbi:MAG: rhamnulokinase family protein [Bryobacteraceae bacterium]
MNRHYLALDLGAESGRAILAQVAKGQIELQELHRFPNIPVQLPTGLYWDTLRLFHEMCEGIRCGAKAADQIDGIAIDTWGVDFGLVGADGELLHMPRHYRDHRNVSALKQALAVMPRDEIFRQTGIQFMEINSLYQLWAMRRDSPGLLDRVSKLLFMPDLFNYFLTGAFAAERTIASTSQFYNPVKKGFATDMLRKLGIPGNFFAELVDPATELGPVLPYAANRCGLKRDTLVYTTGSHDTASAVAAVPAVGDGWCYISSGTWSLMGVETTAPIINEESLEANFTNEIGVAGTVRFLKNIPGLWVLQECRRAWAKAGSEYTYAELTGHASQAKGIDTILNLDEFVSPGDHPERIRQFCVASGQEVPTDVGGITRVILQSLAERYRQVLELLERLGKKSIETIHIVGGGSQNSLLNQMVADRTGRRVVAGPAEATALGNALTQAMGTGQINSLEEMRAVVRGSFELHEFRPTT